MAEYINKQQLLNEIEEWNIVSFYELNEHSTEAYHDIKNDVKAMTSIDLVLCRDCKEFYFASNRISVQRGWVCGRYGEHRKPDDYCSKGERVSEDD